MANYIFTWPGNAALPGANRVPRYIVAETDAGKPTSGYTVGDLVVTIDTAQVYKATDATTLVELASGSATPRESLVAMWTEPSTKTNIGTSFVDVYVSTNSAGLPVKVDFTGKTQFAASIQWDKIGTGAQNVRAVDADNVNNVLFDAVVVSGDNDVALATLPAFATGVKRIKLQCKSATSTDDPVFRGCSIRLK